MKIAITCPIYISNPVSKKYLDLTTQSIKSKENDLVWVPCENYVKPDCKPLVYNFSQPLSDIRILHPESRQSVSKAWNIGIEEGANAGADYILVINQDILLKANTIDRLITFAVNHQEAVLWTPLECRNLPSFKEYTEKEGFTEHASFSCFLIKFDFFKHVGKFDENFIPAYFEDEDMRARLAIARKKICGYNGARFLHFVSQAVKNDKDLFLQTSKKFPDLEKYFIKKWGHEVVHNVELMEKVYFKHPYNENDKPLSYFRNLS